MSVQVIMKEGRPEWAVLPYEDYEALLAKVETLSAALQGKMFSGNRSDTMPTKKPPTVAQAPDASQAEAIQTTASPAQAVPSQERIQTGLSAETPPAQPSLLLGQKIAQLREKAGLDIAAVARDVGISPVYLEQMEQGKRVPSEPILRNIARALGVAQDYFASP